MNKKTLKIITIFFMTLIIWIALNTISAAASFDASISSTNIKVGDTVTVTVKANNAAGMYSVSANNSNMSKVSGDTSEFLENKSTTITYKAVKAGTTTITAKASDMTDLDDDSKPVTGSKTFTVTIKSNETTTTEQPKQEEPKKGTIDTCYINGIKVKEYLNVTNKDSVSVKVNTSTKEGLTIYNSLTKKSYKVKSGETANVQILEGTNTLTITLDTGAKATRKIYSQKEEEVKPNVIEEKPQEEVKVLLKSLSVKGVKAEEDKIDLSFTPEFSAEVYEYKILLDETLEDITKLDIEAKASQDDFKVEITGNEELKEGENTITITVKSKDGKTTTTYKILVTKEAKVVPIVAPTVEVEQEVIKPLWNRTQQILITVFTSIIALMGIAYAVIEYRYKKEPETKIPNSGTTLEEDMNKEVEEDKIGEIPFAKVGFEKEEDSKVDILKEETQPEFKDIKEQKNAKEEELKKQTKTKRGKHF
ncbi:MAG: cadherin-like beta sandwich domain-containing protein [Clostridia bacterium]|nr:cadherin-like beta sandwich domain-containing protein [Clostridia bacterium]